MARDLNDTLIFVRVVERGSFIAAAQVLGLPKTTVSRKIQELETRLGVQLLNRTTRRIGLTEAGAVYFEHCQRIARELDEAESAVSQLQGGPRGLLRVTAPYSVGVGWLAPLLGRFHAQYPEVRVDLVLTDEKLDLISHEIDVALRKGPLDDSSLVARRLSTVLTHVFASPLYLQQYGEPLKPDDLVHHRTLAYSLYRRKNQYYWPLVPRQSTPTSPWPVHAKPEPTEFNVNPVLIANDAAALYGALVCGQGIMLASAQGMAPHVESGRLVRVLEDWEGPQIDLMAVFPSGLTVSPKVRAFVDFLVEYMTTAGAAAPTCKAMPDLETMAAAAAELVGTPSVKQPLPAVARRARTAP